MNNKKQLPAKYNDSIRYKLLENGAVQDLNSGRLVANVGPYPITKETSQLMHARKRELVKQRAIEGIDEAAIESGRLPSHTEIGSGEGWKQLVKHVAATLLKSSNLRGQAEAARFLGKAADYISDYEESENESLSEMRQLFRQLADAVRKYERQSADVIDASAE